MSGFIFGLPIGPNFNFFLENYLVILLYEKTTTYITVLALYFFFL